MQNVLFVKGRIVLADFGNAQVFDVTIPATRFGNEPRYNVYAGCCLFVTKCVHTPRRRPFAAPELCQGNNGTYLLPPTDMWSCGALLHYLLTGAPVLRLERAAVIADRVGTCLFLALWFKQAVDWSVPQTRHVQS